MGKPGQINDSEVQACIADVRDACRQKGKPLGIFAMNADTAPPLMAQGYSLVAVGTAALFLAESTARALTVLQGRAA